MWLLLFLEVIMLKSILSILLLCSISYSSSLNFSFDGDFGIVPKTMSQAYEYPSNYKYVAYRDVFFLTLNPRIEWKFIYGDLTFSTFSCKTKTNHTFIPFRNVWKNEIGFFKDFNNVRLSIAWDHLCGHRSMPDVSGKENFDLFDNAYDRIFLRFSYTN